MGKKTASAVKTAGQSAKKKPAKKAAPKKAPAAKISAHDIALRAYFISEKRRAHNLPGDAHQDWIEAERELRAAAARKKPAKKPTAR